MGSDVVTALKPSPGSLMSVGKEPNPLVTMDVLDVSCVILVTAPPRFSSLYIVSKDVNNEAIDGILYKFYSQMHLYDETLELFFRKNLFLSNHKKSHLQTIPG